MTDEVEYLYRCHTCNWLGDVLDMEYADSEYFCPNCGKYFGLGKPDNRYCEPVNVKRLQALDELAAQAQELNMGYE